MIHSLEGIIIRNNSTDILMSCGPMVLKVSIPLSASGQLAAEGSNQKLYTCLIWKETGPLLFGFLHPDHVEIFERLQTVSGIGTRHALSLMGLYAPSELARFLQNGDAAALSRVPGIGLKTAQRLIIELKDKAIRWITDLETPLPHLSSLSEDALKALVNLGYNQNQARRMLDQANSSHSPTDLGSLITAALQFA
jgi:Holliday junction DNA helicase RuvA